MSTSLSALVDRVVRRAASNDGLLIMFDGDITLSIHNPTSWSGPASTDVVRIEGRRVVSAESEALGVRMAFDDGSVLLVDLQDAAFSEAEAMVLRIPGQPIVVWN